MSVMANLLPDGMGFGHYVSTPGLQAFDPPRTMDNGIGMFGFFKAAKSYVFRDPSFGLIGAGCDVKTSGERVTATLRDGLRKRVRFAEQRLDVEAEKGGIVSAAIDASGRSLALEMADSTALVATGRIIVKGLAPGRYTISYGKKQEIRTVSEALALEWSLKESREIKIVRS